MQFCKQSSISVRFSNSANLYREKNTVNKYIENIIEKEYCKKVIKHFNKTLVMLVQNERSFQSNNKCWICN